MNMRIVVPYQGSRDGGPCPRPTAEITITITTKSKSTFKSKSTWAAACAEPGPDGHSKPIGALVLVLVASHWTPLTLRLQCVQLFGVGDRIARDLVALLGPADDVLVLAESAAERPVFVGRVVARALAAAGAADDAGRFDGSGLQGA
jgi:hypothetical protein